MVNRCVNTLQGRTTQPCFILPEPDQLLVTDNTPNGHLFQTPEALVVKVAQPSDPVVWTPGAEQQEGPVSTCAAVLGKTTPK